MMVLFFVIVSLLNGIGALFLGFLVLLKTRKSNLHRLFFLLNLAIATWALSYWRWLSSDNYTAALFWTRTLSIGSTLIPIFFLHWILLLVSKTKEKKILLRGGYIMTAIFLLFGFSSLFVRTVEPRFGFPFWPIPGILYHFYVLFSYVSLLGYGIYQLFVHYHRAQGHLKTQMKYIFLGLAIAAPAGFSNFLLWYNINFPPYLNVFVLSYMGCYTYAMLKYRLMDIRVVLGKTAVYLLSFLATVGVSFLLMFANNRLAQPVSQNVFLPAIIIIAVLLYQLFFRIFEKIASRFFYYSFYSSQKVLAELGEKLVGILDISQLSNTIAQTLISTMKLDRTVVLLREKTGRYVILKNIGFKEENGISLVKDNFLTEFLEKTRQPLVFEELSLAERDAKTEKEKGNLRKLQDNMKSIEANVCLPLFRGKDIIGIIILGKKVSGDSYSREDMELLIALTNQASIAFENAKLYDEIQDLSQNLQEKVAEQTKELQESYQKVEAAYEIEKQAHQELKRIDEAKSQFIMATQHHLRTPLTALKGYLSMSLEGDFGEVGQVLKEKLASCFESTNRLIKLVNEFLDLSKLQLGKNILDIKEASITEMLQDVIVEVKPEADKKGIYLILALPPEPASLIMADAVKLREALYNLIDNAVKYTEKGGVKVDLRFVVKGKKNYAEIVVTDTGIGMTKQEADDVFGRQFERGKEAKKVYALGRGIGLFITASIIKAHKGKIWAESSGQGQGSLFYVELVAKQ